MELKFAFFLIFIASFCVINAKVVKIPLEDELLVRQDGENYHKIDKSRLESVRLRAESKSQRGDLKNRRKSVQNEEIIPVIQPFNDSSLISCAYQEPLAPLAYTCHLQLNNPTGRDDFNEIAGDHADGFTNSDVITVMAMNQNSRNIPLVICNQFPNLLDLIVELSAVEVIGADAFAECVNLEFLMIGLNRIASLPDRLFRNNPDLQVRLFF